MNEENISVVIFDLDGTLLDTSRGIYGSVRFVERQMRLEPISMDKLREFIGPPPMEMYRRIYGLDTEAALKATKLHREYGLNHAIFEADIYNGIPEVISSIRNRGFLTAVATLKKQEIAEKMLENFRLTILFDKIVGMDDDESLTKEDIIKDVIVNTKADKAIMVGDSSYDYEGAVRSGIDFIGVSYGFGFSDNIKYPFLIARKPEEIMCLI